MRLFKDLANCNLRITALSTSNSTIDIADGIARTNYHPLVKYYAFKHLNAEAHLQTFITQSKPSEKEAELCFIEIRNYFMRLPGSDNQHFSELLILFSEYYAGTSYAAKAADWAESLQQPLLNYTFSFMLRALQCVANFVIENPVKSTLLILLAATVVVDAQTETKSTTKALDIVLDGAPVNQPTYISTSDPEFKTTVKTNSMEELIALKVKVDPALQHTASAAFIAKCKRVESLVAQAMAREHHAHITRVLINPKFKGIICTNEMKDDNNSDVNGMFDITKDAIIVNPENRDEELIAVIVHEFLHADSYYRHINRRCLSTGAKITPVNNETPALIEQWNMAFDLGDKRVEAFYQLWIKRHHGNTLSKAEKLKLQQYEDAISGSGICHTTEKNYLKSVNDRIIDAIRKKGMKPVMINIKEGEREFPGMIAFALPKKDDNTFSIIVHPTNAAQSLFLHNIHAKNTLNGFYSTYTPANKLSEREAWTFMYLTPKAADFFYPEVYVLRKLEVNQCATHSLDNLNKRIRVALFFADPSRELHQKDEEAVFEETGNIYIQVEYQDIVSPVLKKLAAMPNWKKADYYLAKISIFNKDYSSACKHLTSAHAAGLGDLVSHKEASEYCLQAELPDQAKQNCVLGLSFFAKHLPLLNAKIGEAKTDASFKSLVEHCKTNAGM